MPIPNPKEQLRMQIEDALETICVREICKLKRINL
jgi:hypothetical protein